MPAAAKSNENGHSSPHTSSRLKKHHHSDGIPESQTHQDPFFSTSGKKGSFFQAKLTVNRIHDSYEREADQVSEEVVQNISSGREGGFFPPAAPYSGQGDTSVRRSAFFQRKPAFESPTELEQNSANTPELQTKRSVTMIPPLQRMPAFESPTDMEENSAARDDIHRSVQQNPVKTTPPAPAVHRRDDEIAGDGSGDDNLQLSSKAQSQEGQVNSGFESRLKSTKGRGTPIEAGTRQKMESAFGADFSEVRIHTGSEAESMNNKVFAHAFTHGKDIYFNQNKYQPGTREGSRLLAHELTHVVQQGGATKTGVQRKAVTSVNQSAPTMVQRLGIQDALDYFADKANNIPGFAMLTVILGFNPINGRDVPRNAANIFRGIMGFLPGGDLIWQALNNHGIFTQVGDWITRQLDTLGDIGNSIKNALRNFLDSLSWTDIFDLGGVWRRAVRIFTDPIDRIISFVRGLVTDILNFIRDAILRPLASLAEGTRGWDLLIAVLGFNPITGDPVPRTADTLIGGFMKLIGQEEVWANIQRANAIPRAWAWFQGTLGQLIGFVSQIPALFIKALKSLEIIDMVLVPRAFIKIGKVFAGFVGDFISWALNAVWELLKIIFEVVAPGAIPYLNKTAAAFKTILANPMGFVRNLVKAGKLGFEIFKNNFVSILKDVLIDWLTGTLAGAGIYIPQSLDFLEILKFILSILGISWANIRAKLVKYFGEGPVVVLEEGFELIKLLVTEGPAAAWEKIKEHIANLKDTVISEIISWVTKTVVEKAVIKITTALIPGAGFIQAIITIYDVILVFIQRLQKIIQVAMAFLNSIVQIASGNIMPAAQKIVNTLKGILTLAVSFLAGFAGLGKISDAIQNVLKKIRDPIDKAIDKMVAWVAAKAKGFLKKKDEDKHQQIATAASGELKQGDDNLKTYAELRNAKIEKAKQIEQSYQGQLKEGMKIKISFADPVKDQEDKALDYTVTIAPNNTDVTGKKPISDEFKLKLGSNYLVNHTASGGWELGVVSKEQIVGETKITFFNIMSGDKKGTSFGLPNEKLKDDIEKGTEQIIKPYNNQAKGDPSGPYAHLPDPPNVGPYKEFTSDQKAKIIQANINKNGKLVSDKSGKELDPAEMRAKGKKVNPNEVNIDHKWPRSEGGWNTYANAQALSFSENLKKLAKLPV